MDLRGAANGDDIVEQLLSDVYVDVAEGFLAEGGDGLAVVRGGGVGGIGEGGFGVEEAFCDAEAFDAEDVVGAVWELKRPVSDSSVVLRFDERYGLLKRFLVVK